MALDDSTMVHIMRDIQGEVPVAQSKLTYTNEMKLWRNKVEKEFEDWKKANNLPDAELEIPNTIDSLPGK
jgi:hypothetical protein